MPVVAHEVGQWCAYPDYGVIRKFTGYLRPDNYNIFRDSLAAHGLAARDKDFALASGRFQLACYKEEVEANLRTSGLSGFELLDLHDYVGQGTALVGLLDPFWESKGYAEPREFREFCEATVPLARLPSRVFTTDGNFDINVEIAHYGPAAADERGCRMEPRGRARQSGRPRRMAGAIHPDWQKHAARQGQCRPVEIGRTGGLPINGGFEGNRGAK